MIKVLYFRITDPEWKHVLTAHSEYKYFHVHEGRSNAINYLYITIQNNMLRFQLIHCIQRCKVYEAIDSENAWWEQSLIS